MSVQPSNQGDYESVKSHATTLLKLLDSLREAAEQQQTTWGVVLQIDQHDSSRPYVGNRWRQSYVEITSSDDFFDVLNTISNAKGAHESIEFYDHLEATVDTLTRLETSEKGGLVIPWLTSNVQANLANQRKFRGPYLRLLALIAELRTALDSLNSEAAIGNVTGSPSTRASIGWAEAKDAADEIRLKGQPWTSYREMAKTIGCKPSVLHDAISKHGSVELNEWATKPHKKSRKDLSPAESSLAIEACGQTRESDPAETLYDCDVDAVMQSLLEQANPAEQQRIQMMSPAEKRRLAVTYYQDPETDEKERRFRRAKRKSLRAD